MVYILPRKFMHVIKCHSMHRPQTMTAAVAVHGRNKIKKTPNENITRLEKWKIVLFCQCMRYHLHVLQLAQYSIFIDVKQALTQGEYMEKWHQQKNIALSHTHPHTHTSKCTRARCCVSLRWGDKRNNNTADDEMWSERANTTTPTEIAR